ncbi:hypothetical protein SLU01_19350 [Sporosarcina luteola]|uniref:Uncharacterized protein n=1 Tax=Sporosarcina luteola TaxID=582850 RepID=A0A511Z855_9BACL|nr:hypothetical protein [Sporosarcina luteola]GEN83623.1 hypothetical protein SLU01_19350 [Sporosarcina luteola]
MNMPIRALETIRHSGMVYKPGDIVNGLSDSEKERLLLLKSAERVETFSDVVEVVQEVDVDPELFKELRDDLDANYNADELKRAAKNAGVQFDAKDTKEKVMEAVIKQGKVELLLEDGE